MRGWEANVRAVTPYTPGEQPKLSHVVKLNTNENPYPPSPLVAQKLKSFDPDTLRLYPDPAMSSLVQGLADRYGVDREQVFVGVGSDDVLSMAFLAFFNSGRPVLFPDITYSFYDVWAEVYGIPYEQIPLDRQFGIVKEDYRRENGGVVFPNPNAPTGAALALSEIEDILCHNRDVVVIVDEAYVDFGTASAIPLVEKYDNLLVVQTFSKSRSMAGLRVGFAVGSKKLIGYLYGVRNSVNSYTMNRFALELGACALKDEAYFRKTCQKIVNTRERVKKELAALGFVFPDSKANFIFASHPAYDAKKLFEALRQQHIFVRYFEKPRISSYLRITVGTDEQMDILLAFLKKYMKKETPDGRFS